MNNIYYQQFMEHADIPEKVKKRLMLLTFKGLSGVSNEEKDKIFAVVIDPNKDIQMPENIFLPCGDIRVVFSRLNQIFNGFIVGSLNSTDILFSDENCKVYVHPELVERNIFETILTYSTNTQIERVLFAPYVYTANNMPLKNVKGAVKIATPLNIEKQLSPRELLFENLMKILSKLDNLKYLSADEKDKVVKINETLLKSAFYALMLKDPELYDKLKNEFNLNKLNMLKYLNTEDKESEELFRSIVKTLYTAVRNHPVKRRIKTVFTHEARREFFNSVLSKLDEVILENEKE